MSETVVDHGVRVIRAWGSQRVGNVIFPNGVFRDQLVKGGFVERLTVPKASATEERMMSPRRGKPYETK